MATSRDDAVGARQRSLSTGPVHHPPNSSRKRDASGDSQRIALLLSAWVSTRTRDLFAWCSTGRHSCRSLPHARVPQSVAIKLMNATWDAAAVQTGSRISAEAAQAAQAELQAKAASRARVERGIVGEWVGMFSTQANSRLTITRSEIVISAVLLAQGWREVLTGEVTSDDKLLLTGTSATRVGPSASGVYNLDTVQLELSADGVSLSGQYRDAIGHTGSSSGTANFNFTPPTAGWPKGQYSLEVLVMDGGGAENDKKSVSFTVF
jgi:hypothetical protein